MTDPDPIRPTPRTAPTADDVRRRLAAFRERRGYLLPHQGAMAAALPELQDIYGVIYRILTLDPHHLDAFEREFVWLALLTAAEEKVGTHHIDLFFRTGGTDAQADAVFRLVAWARGAKTYAYLDQAWQQYFPATPAARAYVDGLDDLLHARPEVDPALARLALAGCHAAWGDHWPLRVALRACYDSGMAEAKIAETFSLVLWPCGMNRFLDASEVWLQLMRSGEVQPSPPFKAWAETEDQGGFHLPPRDAPR
jgi:alkylhydroperoxidase/carboxymuconolactone decarboxylase family protein YurZ